MRRNRECRKKYIVQREKEWDLEKGEDFDYAKKAILEILREQNVSLTKVRRLFHSIIDDIEDENVVNRLPLPSGTVTTERELLRNIGR